MEITHCLRAIAEQELAELDFESTFYLRDMSVDTARVTAHYLQVWSMIPLTLEGCWSQERNYKWLRLTNKHYKLKIVLFYN